MPMSTLAQTVVQRALELLPMNSQKTHETPSCSSMALTGKDVHLKCVKIVIHKQRWVGVEAAWVVGSACVEALVAVVDSEGEVALVEALAVAVGSALAQWVVEAWEAVEAHRCNQIHSLTMRPPTGNVAKLSTFAT